MLELILSSILICLGITILYNIWLRNTYIIQNRNGALRELYPYTIVKSYLFSSLPIINVIFIIYHFFLWMYLIKTNQDKIWVRNNYAYRCLNDKVFYREEVV